MKEKTKKWLKPVLFTAGGALVGLAYYVSLSPDHFGILRIITVEIYYRILIGNLHFRAPPSSISCSLT